MKEFTINKPFSVLTHADLDGVGCVIALRAAAENSIKYITKTGYPKLAKNVEKCSTQSDQIILTDLSPKQDVINSIPNMFESALLIDHHDTSKNLKIPFKSVINSVSKFACGTSLTYSYLIQNGYTVFSEEQKYLFKVINDWDNFNLTLDDSILLNNLYWDLGFWEFYDTFKNGLDWKWYPKLHQRAIDIKENKEKTIRSFEQFDVEGVKIIIADDHISDISLVYDNHAFFIVRPNNEISVRTKEMDLNPFYALLKQNGIEGGGHKNAGGFSIKNESDLMGWIEVFCKMYGSI